MHLQNIRPPYLGGRDKEGFSLLELVVAVSIMLIIAVVAFISYQNFTDNARQAAVERAASDVFTAALAADSTEGGASLSAELQRIQDEYNETAGDDLAVEVEHDDPDITVTARGWDGRYIAVRSTNTDLDGGTPGNNESSEEEASESFTGDINDYNGVFRFTTSEPGVIDLQHIADGTTITHNGETTVIEDATPDWETMLEEKYEQYGITDWRSQFQEMYGVGWEYMLKIEPEISTGTIIELPTAGEYTIEGAFQGIGGSEKSVIREVLKWEDTGTVDISFAFSQNSNDIVFQDTPPGTIEAMAGTFSYAPNFNDDISDWDTSNVTTMHTMFGEASSFNQDISRWNVSNVEDMNSMFAHTQSFDQDISDWNVSNAQDMKHMFMKAESFDNGGEPLDWGEKTGSVRDMTGMFNRASRFNQDVSDWNVSNVQNMASIFHLAKAFNQNISGWDMSNVQSMAHMFSGASSFNQDISKWDTSSATAMNGMFQVAEKFDQDISDWDVSNVSNMQVMFADAKSFDNGGEPLDWGEKTKNVVYMYGMFHGATSFNQSISSWNVSSVEDTRFMFENADAFDNGGEPMLDWMIKAGA